MIHQFRATDPQERLFIDLKASLEKYRDSLRRRNDGHMTEIETATLRGEIKTTTALLNAMGAATKAK